MNDLGVVLGSAIEQVVTSNPVALANPGQSVVASRLYSTVDNTQLDVVPVLATYGRTRISSNNLNFGASSQFQISPQSIMSTILVVGTVAYNRYVFASSMWLLDAIESISYQLSGASSIAQIQYSGQSHKDLLLSACRSKEKRNGFFEADNYINGNAAGGTAVAAIPLYLPWSGPSDLGYWSFDSSTLSSNIIVTINWKPAYKIFNAINGQSPVLPTAFSNLFITCEMEDLLASQFKISNAMRMDPSLSYNVPIKYVQTYEVPISVTPGSPFSVSLSALPNGQLLTILVSARPVASYGASNGSILVQPEGKLFSYASLMYNGEQLVLYDNEKVKKCYQNYFSDGGGYEYEVVNMTSFSNAAEARWTGEVLQLALNHAPCDVLSEPYTQAVRSYGGSTLNFTGTIRSLQGDGSTGNPTGDYIITFTYVFNAIIVTKDGVTSMIM